MTSRRRSAVMALLIISIAAPVAFGGDYFVYAPKQVVESGESIPQVGKEEILVREILVKKGDTLSKLSRRYSGRGSYYPQILLFNEIKNPNLIYTGDTLKLPVGKPRHTAEATRPVSPEKGAEAEQKPLVAAGPVEPQKVDKPSVSSKKQKDGRKKRGMKKGINKGTRKSLSPAGEAVPAVRPVATPESAAPASPSTSAGKAQQELFDQAVSSYRNNDCKTAVELFDRFLAENEASPLAAEASLFKAECLLKLSGTL